MDNYVYEDCATNRTGRVKLSFKHINYGLALLALSLASVQAAPSWLQGLVLAATRPGRA